MNTVADSLARPLGHREASRAGSNNMHVCCVRAVVIQRHEMQSGTGEAGTLSPGLGCTGTGRGVEQ